MCMTWTARELRQCSAHFNFPSSCCLMVCTITHLNVMNQRREPKPTSLLQFVKISKNAFSKVEFYFQKGTKKECWIWDNVLSAQKPSKMTFSPKMGLLQWEWKNQFKPWFEWIFWPWFYLSSQWSSFFSSVSPLQLAKFFFWHFFSLNVSEECSLSV